MRRLVEYQIRSVRKPKWVYKQFQLVGMVNIWLRQRINRGIGSMFKVEDIRLAHTISHFLSFL